MRIIMKKTTIVSVLTAALILFAPLTASNAGEDTFKAIADIERERILSKAAELMGDKPRTVTADKAERSEGGVHDFFSEGDYWWPDPANPDGKYIRRDGESNPDNFLAHRLSLMKLSDYVGTFTSAYLLTRDKAYADRATMHLKAWFVDDATKMNPSLLYGQAIQGRHTGRSIGVIDTIHLTEVARAAKVLEEKGAIKSEDIAGIKTWFKSYMQWLNTHPYGLREKQHPNNHGVAWSMQVASFASLVGDEEMLEWIRNQFKTVYLDNMMDERGGFPLELGRTKPYGYSLFVIDLMASVAEIASTEDDNLWTFTLEDGRNMVRGLDFITPYIADKSTWPLKPDVQYYDEWPVRHPALLFAARELKRPDYLALWKRFEADPTNYETRRNLPLRYPLLWQ